MSRNLVIAPTPTSAKQCVPRRSAPVSSRSSTANTRAHNSASDSANSCGVRIVWGAHASRVLARASRDRELSFEVVNARPGGAAENKIVSARRQHARRVRSPELATASRTHTSTVPDRARLLSASPEDRRPHLTAALQKLSNPNRTSVQHRLLVASVTTSSAAPEKQIFRRQGAPDRSRNFVGWTVERRTKLREFNATAATESMPTA